MSAAQPWKADTPPRYHPSMSSLPTPEQLADILAAAYEAATTKTPPKAHAKRPRDTKRGNRGGRPISEIGRQIPADTP